MANWIRTSQFGTGPRVPMARNDLDLYRAKLVLMRRPGGISSGVRDVGEALSRMIGRDGRLNPTIEHIAAAARQSVSTVKRALATLRRCGFVSWVNRIVRVNDSGWKVAQTSNAYVLTIPSGEGQIALQVNTKILRKKASGWFGSQATLKGIDQEAHENAARCLRLLGMPIPTDWNLAKPG